MALQVEATVNPAKDRFTFTFRDCHDDYKRMIGAPDAYVSKMTTYIITLRSFSDWDKDALIKFVANELNREYGDETGEVNIILREE